MSSELHCKRFLRLIDKHAAETGRALRSAVEAEYGEGWQDAWRFAYDRGYLDRGGERHVWQLTPAGRRAAVR